MTSLFLTIRIQNELEQLGDMKYDPSATAHRGHEASELMSTSQFESAHFLRHSPNAHRLHFELDLAGMPGFRDHRFMRKTQIESR